jgi:hypothetical protein
MLSEIASFETLEVLVPYGPLCATDRTISGDLPKAHGSTENMTDAVHPSGFPTLKMGIDDGDPIINLLQGQPVFWR